MELWVRWGGNSLFLCVHPQCRDGVGPGDLFLACPLCDLTQIPNNYLLFSPLLLLFFFMPLSLFFLLLITLHPRTAYFFFLLSLPFSLLCIGSGVWAVMWLFVWTQLPVFAIGQFLWKSVGFQGDGEWRHHFTFLCSCPSPLHCFEPVFLCVSSTGCGGSGSCWARHTQTVTGLSRSSSSPSSPFSSGSQSPRRWDCSRWVKQMFFSLVLHFFFLCVSFLVEPNVKLVFSCAKMIWTEQPRQFRVWLKQWQFILKLNIS